MNDIRDVREAALSYVIYIAALYVSFMETNAQSILIYLSIIAVILRIYIDAHKLPVVKKIKRRFGSWKN